MTERAAIVAALSGNYEEWLDWFGEQPCDRCYVQNRHCVCRELDDRFGDIPFPQGAAEEDDQ